MFRNSINPYGQPLTDKQVEDAVKRLLPQQTLSPKRQKRMRSLHNWCGNFNLPQGCSNPPSGTGCVDNTGKILKHGCSVRKDGKMCNATEHNKPKHTG